jgi:hypothetical protein
MILRISGNRDHDCSGPSPASGSVSGRGGKDCGVVLSPALIGVAAATITILTNTLPRIVETLTDGLVG